MVTDLIEAVFEPSKRVGGFSRLLTVLYVQSTIPVQNLKEMLRVDYV